MSLHEDSSARSLINAAGLHAYNTVLNDIYDTDAVFAAEGVQLADDVSNLHLLTVYAGRNTFLEGHGNVLTLIRCFLRGIA